MELFTYILSNVFRMGSFYMQKRVGSFHEEFSKNTYYRFFQNVHANWLRFTTMLSERIVNQHLRPLTSDSREDCFVIDDTLYERAGYKRTELAARVFDHVGMRFRKGFRLLTLGWTDGCTFLPSISPCFPPRRIDSFFDYFTTLSAEWNKISAMMLN